MNNRMFYQHIIILLYIFICTCRMMPGQPVYRDIPADGLQEKVALCTDREVYCVDEPLFFKAYNNSNQQLRSVNWSTVLYIEIITPDGKPVYQGKYRYDSTGAAGNIIIPHEIATGNYYLRAYTKWMRNFSVYHYFYKIITIINPYQAELLKPQSEFIISQEFYSLDSARYPGFIVSTDKPIYQTRDNVLLTIQNSGSDTGMSHFCVSVIKSGIIRPLLYRIPPVENHRFHLDYIPETRSATLTGKLINLKDSSPVPYTQITLSILNPIKCIYATLTDDDGYFYFSLPEFTGETEVYLSSKNPNGLFESEIYVDNDFCTKEVKLPFIPVSQDKKDKEFYNELIFNTQLANKYKIINNIEQLKDSAITPPFYGSSVHSVRFSDFIPLPSMKDYFNELFQNVTIRKKNKEKYFQILGPYAELYIYEPLVLVDYMAVNQVDRILSISPRKVNRIDVIDKPYILGDLCYGGIIHVISEKGDFAGVNLPSSGQFIQFIMYASTDSGHLKKEENPRIPDARNLLYWNPEVCLTAGQSESFTFFTADTPGEYAVIMRSADDQGNEIQNRCRFIVE